jgi:hypothetical protein
MPPRRISPTANAITARATTRTDRPCSLPLPWGRRGRCATYWQWWGHRRCVCTRPPTSRLLPLSLVSLRVSHSCLSLCRVASGADAGARGGRVGRYRPDLCGSRPLSVSLGVSVCRAGHVVSCPVVRRPTAAGTPSRTLISCEIWHITIRGFGAEGGRQVREVRALSLLLRVSLYSLLSLCSAVWGGVRASYECAQELVPSSWRSAAHAMPPTVLLSCLMALCLHAQTHLS